MEDVGICRDVIGCGFDGWICSGTGGSSGGDLGKIWGPTQKVERRKGYARQMMRCSMPCLVATKKHKG